MMARFLSFCRMMLAALILLSALLALPVSMAWSALPGMSELFAEQQSEDWASSVDTRFNLYRMQPDLYRSALPDSRAQPFLKTLGITTVINFYQESDEQWLGKDSGIRQVHIPLHADRVRDSDVIRVLRKIRQAQTHGAVLIHCKHGNNRTGLMAAMYRIVYQGWSKQEALAEMNTGGFGGEGHLEDAERYVREADVNAVRVAMANGACSTSPWSRCMMISWLTSLFNRGEV